MKAIGHNEMFVGYLGKVVSVLLAINLVVVMGIVQGGYVGVGWYGKWWKQVSGMEK